MSDTNLLKCKNCGKLLPQSGRKTKFCGRECYLDFQNRIRREKIGLKTVKCEICGKEFEVTKNSQKKRCSKECKKRAWTIYNTNYQAKRRAEDPEYYKKSLETASRIARTAEGIQKWSIFMDCAKTILQLANEENAQQLIAKYIDINFRIRTGAYSTKRILTEEEQGLYEKLKELKVV